MDYMTSIVHWMNFARRILFFFFHGIFRYLRKDELHGISPGIAFYFIMGFIPFLVFIVNIMLSVTESQLDSIVEMLYLYFPERVAITIEDDIQRILKQQNNLWSFMGLIASSASFAQGLGILVRATDPVNYQNPEARKQGLISYMDYVVASKAFLLAIGLIIAIILSLGLTVFGNAIVQFLEENYQLPDVFLNTWYLLKYLLPFIVLILFLTIFYWAAPCFVPPLWPCFIAAFLVTILWLVATGTYSWIMLFLPSMGESYGPLVGLFVLFLWFRYIAYIIIIGIGFTKTWDKWHELQTQWKSSKKKARESIQQAGDPIQKEHYEEEIRQLEEGYGKLLIRLTQDEEFWKKGSRHQEPFMPDISNEPPEKFFQKVKERFKTLAGNKQVEEAKESDEVDVQNTGKGTD